MQLSNVLKTLYSDNSSKIYFVLNESVYITEFNLTEKAILFHTGFRFQTHKKTLIDIYFELKSSTIIRHNVGNYYRKVPQIIGYICSTGEKKYIDTVSDSLVICLDNKNSNADIYNRIAMQNIAKPESLIMGDGIFKKISILTDNGAKKLHSSFQIIENHEKTIKLPLQKIFDEVVFYDGVSFSEYQPDRYVSSNYLNDDRSDDWTCDACGGSSNTGCMSSTGECYM